MIYFKVDGVDLDIPKDLNLSFQKKNILFSFDDIELNRSQSFTLPRSQTNDAIFQFSFRPDFDGAVTRVTHFAEMFYSGGKEEGILSCISANDNGYECIFVFGELRNLKKIKEAGKISEYFDLPVLPLEWGDDTAAGAANDHNFYIKLFAMLKYKTDAPESEWQNGINVLPSVRLDALIELCCAFLSVDVDIAFPDIHPRIILSSTLGRGAEVTIGYEKTATYGFNLSAEIALSPAIDGAEVGDFTFQCFDGHYMVFAIPVFTKTTIRTKGIRFNRKMEVMFKAQTAISTNKYPVWFLDPGDVVSFEEGDYFTFVSRNASIHYFDGAPYFYGGAGLSGYINGFTLPESGTFGVRQLDNISYNMTYRLKDNLPDVTLIDLLKTYAHIYNRLLFYDAEENKFSFFDGNFTNTPISLDERIIKLTDVKRTIGTFAQKNKVVCDSEDYVLDVNKYNFFYNISNETIEKEKTIVNIPFSEGNILSEGSVQYVKLSDLEYTGSEWKVVAKTPTIAIAGDQPYMTRIRQLAPANDINEIFEISTTLNISVQMYLFEFLQIKPKDVFLVRGIRYAYFSATWNKNIANLVLIKIK
jgi:hypothetical protein